MSYLNHDPFTLGCAKDDGPRRVYQNWIKRPVDLFLIILALPFLLPLLLLVGLAVRASGHPVLYSQSRVGRGGKTFRFWKFRTMAPGADAELAALLASDPKLAQEWRTRQKLGNDPRVTRVGRFLRRSSLDELPQVWNVIRGDMSLVGPRPFLPEQRDLYDLHTGTAGYYRIRPGMTGLWQVSDRNGCGFKGRVHLDDRYFRDFSLAQDLVVICRTIRAIYRGTGV